MRQLGGASDGDVRQTCQSRDVLTPAGNVIHSQEHRRSSQECAQASPRQSAADVKPAQSAADVKPVQSKVVAEALTAVTERLSWATDELRRAASIETCCQLCVLIRSCSDAMQSLQRVNCA